jgi:hypothetical protein
MLHLDKEQIGAIVDAIYNEIKAEYKKRTLEHKKVIESSEEFQNVLMACNEYYEKYQALDKEQRALSEEFRKLLNSKKLSLESWYFGDCKVNKSILYSAYLKREGIAPNKVSKNKLKNEVILATMNDGDVESIINSIKEKYCGN